MTPQTSRRYVHVGGGLGDVARRFYLTNTYTVLAEVAEPLWVLCFSHNPAALQFFRHHPNHRKLILIDLGHVYMSLLHDPKFDNRQLNPTLIQLCGLTHEEPITKPREPLPLRAFHAPDPIRCEIPYVVIHPFGRGWGDWPESTQEVVACALRLLPAGVRVYVLAADYIAADGRSKREEFHYSDLPNITVLRNLSAPAAFSLVAGASRFIGTCSSLAQVAAFERIASIVLYPHRCSDFTPPYNDYSNTIWRANGVALPYDEIPVDSLRAVLGRFLETAPTLISLQAEFPSLIPTLPA
jgi:ADP-heptose:LPS heptosyltransferase